MADTGAVAGPAIPIVNLKEEEPAVVKQLHDAFSGIGFIFVVNHSISRQQVRGGKGTSWLLFLNPISKEKSADFFYHLFSDLRL